MKKFILLLFLFVGNLSYGQITKTYEYNELDTLTNADTVTFTTMEFNKPFYFQYSINQDSLSGATAGTITFEYQTKDGTEWHPLYTSIYTDGVAATAYQATINGVNRRFYLSGSLLSGKIRHKIITTGTQSTELTFDIDVFTKTN